MITHAAPIDLAAWARVAIRQQGWRSLEEQRDRTGSSARPYRQREHSERVALGDDTPALLRVRAHTQEELAQSGDCLGLEAAALREVTTVHTVCVLDYLPARKCQRGYVSALAVEPLVGNTLLAVCADSGTIPFGGAATVLLGVGAALAALETAGWVLSGLTLDSVGFRADGCPVLLRYDGLNRVSRDTCSMDFVVFDRFARELSRFLTTEENEALVRILHSLRSDPAWLGRLPSIIRAEIDLAPVPQWIQSDTHQSRSTRSDQAEKSMPDNQHSVSRREGVIRQLQSIASMRYSGARLLCVAVCGGALIIASGLLLR